MNIHRRDRAKAINEESVVVAHSQSQIKSTLPQNQSIIRHLLDEESSLSVGIPSISKRQKSSSIDLELRLGDTSAIH